MVVRARRTLGDALISTGAVMLLLLTLIAIDDRVREQVSLRFRTAPTTDLVTAGTHVRDLATVLFEAARDQSVSHAPLMVFVVAAMLLTLFMLRT
jgi:hypothetical protein